LQAQLRNFIPEMLKFSTGKSKPGWGKPECRPAWWPADVPWANVRSDVRDEEQKKAVCIYLMEFPNFFYIIFARCASSECALNSLLLQFSSHVKLLTLIQQ
jgi:NLS-binding and DNA-binding and dimerisation domains of Nrf1